MHLTPTEWGILELLVRNRGKLVTRQRLMQEVWGPGDRKETSYLRVISPSSAASSSRNRPVPGT